MTLRRTTATLLVLAVLSSAHAEGDASRGAQAFRLCAACHSLEPDRHLTGPSLAGIVGRAAGTAPGFRRYSEALEQSGLSWTEETLERWLADPSAIVPGTSMRIRPIDDPSVRRDLVAFLKSVGETGLGEAASGGMMGGRRQNLKRAAPGQRVAAIRYCPDAYRVTVETGDTYTFWEFNLRFKTDSSPDGPFEGQPAIVSQGMQGDRAQIVFAKPAEMGTFIVEECSDG